MNRLKMSKAKEILRLKERGFSYRAIASSLSCGKTAVAETLRRARETGIGSPKDYTETELEELLFPEKHEAGDSTNKPDLEYLLTELDKKHVTRQLLWEEYKKDHPNGLMYSQFCLRIKQA